MHLSLRRRDALLARLRAEQGFTLTEVLMAMVCGIIVTGALFGILEVSLKQNARITDRTQAQQLGDAAMTRIIDPLRSGCISRLAAPVQAGSTPNELIFTTAFSEATTPELSEVFKETAKYSSHKLTLKSQKATAGAWPTYTKFEEPGKTNTLAENVYMPTGREVPFKYYEYANEASLGTATEGSSTFKAISSEKLTEAQAKKVAAVEVGFEALPTSTDTRQNRGAQFEDRVTFAFSSPSSEGTIKAGPCE